MGLQHSARWQFSSMEQVGQLHRRHSTREVAPLDIKLILCSLPRAMERACCEVHVLVPAVLPKLAVDNDVWVAILRRCIDLDPAGLLKKSLLTAAIELYDSHLGFELSGVKGETLASGVWALAEAHKLRGHLARLARCFRRSAYSAKSVQSGSMKMAFKSTTCSTGLSPSPTSSVAGSSQSLAELSSSPSPTSTVDQPTLIQVKTRLVLRKQLLLKPTAGSSPTSSSSTGPSPTLTLFQEESRPLVRKKLLLKLPA